MRASAKREELLGDSVLDEMKRVQQKAWELLGRAESEGDHRGAIIALREVRECLESLVRKHQAKTERNGGSRGGDELETTETTPLDEKEISLAICNLAMLGWLNVESSSALPINEEELITVRGPTGPMMYPPPL